MNDIVIGVVQFLKHQKPNLDRAAWVLGWIGLVSYVVLPWIGVDVSVRTAIIGIFVILVFNDAW